MARERIDVQELPPSLRDFVKKHPGIWDAHEKLGVECLKAGPLGEKTLRLIKVVVSGALWRETAFKTHVRSALRVGTTAEEIEHALIQLLPMVGLNTTIATTNWAMEVVNDEAKKTRR